MDFLTDNNPKGLRYAIKVASNLPDYILTSDPNTLINDNTDKMHKTAFADSYAKEYPINTPVNTWLSAAYYFTQGRKSAGVRGNEIEKAITSAASMHGIASDIDRLKNDIFTGIAQAQQAAVKHASANRQCVYALSFAQDDASMGRYFLPITTPQDLIKSAHAVMDNIDKIPSIWVKEACLNIASRSKELNMSRRDIPQQILNEGEERLFSYENTMYHAKKRASALNEPLYIELAEAAAADESSIDDCIKGTYKLDILHDINDKYASSDFDKPGNYISPSDMYYSGDTLESVESDLDNYVKVASVIVPREEFKKDSFKNNIRIYFAKQAADKILDNIDTAGGLDISLRLNTLSNEDQKTILKSLL